MDRTQKYLEDMLSSITNIELFLSTRLENMKNFLKIDVSGVPCSGKLPLLVKQ